MIGWESPLVTSGFTLGFLILQDEKLVQTVSLTERVKLWDKFDDRINHHAVKMEFLKKAHRKDPPFRIKYRHPRRRASTVCILIMLERLCLLVISIHPINHY